MPAPKRTPDAKVREALTVWRGNVKAAAGALGMSSNNLRKRMELLGIDLAALRGPAPATSEFPIRSTARRAPPRVLPAHVDRLREAKFDLAARYRLDFTEETVLQAFVEEAFSSWLAAKLEAKP